MKQENIQIQEAAHKWFDSMPFGYKYNYRHRTPLQVIDLWVEEVVMEWYKNGGCSRLEIAKKYCHLYDFSKPLSDSYVAEIYLKEQERKDSNKMGVCDTCGAIQFLSYITCYNGVCKGKIIPQTESKEVSDIKVPAYFKELGVLPKKDTAYIAGALDFGNFKKGKEEPVSVSVEEAAKDYLSKKYGADFNDNKGVIKGANFWKGFVKDMVDFYNWKAAKEQSDKQILEQSHQINLLLKQIDADKDIIGELLDIIKDYDKDLNGLSAQNRLNENGLSLHSHVKSTITKATNYLNQQ